MAEVWLLVRVIVALIPVIRETYRQVREGRISDPGVFAADLHAIMQAAQAADTQEQKQQVAKRLQALILQG